jgi:hypothetical protein
MDVNPLVFTARKAYSIKGIKINAKEFTNLVKSSLWGKDRYLIFMALTTSAHFAFKIKNIYQY